VKRMIHNCLKFHRLFIGKYTISCKSRSHIFCPTFLEIFAL
jgi:hypothetical protein